MRDGRGIRNAARTARMAALGLAIGMGLLLSGDTGVHGAVNVGIDPLEVLNLQVRNNALIVFDTSGSMRFPNDLNRLDLGGDDPRSRMYQAKKAVEDVVEANKNLMNFGLASYNLTKDTKQLRTQGNAFGSGAELRYVSADPEAAVFYQNYTCARGGGTENGFFCGFDNDFGDVNDNSSREVFRSFANLNAQSAKYAWPFSCTGASDCEVYFLDSALFRHGVQFEWDLTSTDQDTVLVNSSPFTVTGTACSDYPPTGLTGDNPDADEDGVADQRRPWIKMVDSGTGKSACFYFSGGIFEFTAGDNTCGGAAQLSVVAPCNGNNAEYVLNEMGPEMPVGDYISSNDFGLGTANTPVDYNGGYNVPLIAPAPAPPAAATNRPTGLRAGQGTPLAGSLQAIRTNTGSPYFPPDPTGGLQKNFVIMLTDGNESCTGETGTGPDSTYRLATSVAIQAQALYDNTGNPQNQAETFVIAFTSNVDKANADRIAQAGSGGNVNTGNGTVTCAPSDPCRPALVAQTTEELVTALQESLEVAVASGTFSASSSVVGTVFELGTANGADPLDPDTRYNDRANAFFLPLFNLPAWDGELLGYKNDGSAGQILVGGTTPWNAGQSLIDNIATPMQSATLAGRPVNRFTFSELHANADARTIGSSAALIKRRIFTSAGGGRWLRTGGTQFDSSVPGGSNVAALWPPNQSLLSPTDNLGNTLQPVDPAVGTPGSLDDALGIGPGSTPVQTFADLQNTLGVCRSSTDADPLNAGNPVPPPTPCATSDMDYARKEARQILLAWVAGAKLVRGTDGRPVRNGAAGVEFGALLYQAKTQFMYDSTLAQPAVMTPPLGATPQVHAREWILYRDGHRNASREGVPGDLNLGFGLRNPDFDDTNPQSKLTLKPRMTVVFYGTNLLLHALNGATAEELWAYLPFDQLRRPLEFFEKGQSRNEHLYGVATALRLADVFVAAPFTEGGFTFEGRWRTVLIFGRGAGGKHMTALDVTSPGPFTRPTLQTNPPWVMWSRGNPDVDLAGNDVSSADKFAYAQMGETWSVPALGSVDSSLGAPEWRLWVGSGYTDDPGDGRTFYEMDVATGDVLFSQDVDAIYASSPGDISSNALVANPAAWNSFQLDPPGTLTRGADKVTRVFIPDLHGRVWKYLPEVGTLQPFYDATVDQPFTEAAALGKLNAGDFVYLGSGRDTRVEQPPQFKIFGIEDVEGDGGNTLLAGTLAFDEDYPDIFRNRTQPAVAFNASGNGRVFFVGQRYNPVSAACISSFDALLFALGAETGAYIYDFDGGGADPYTIDTGKAPGDPSIQGGTVQVPGLGGDPSPTPFTKPSPSPPGEPQIITHSQAIGSPVCRN